MQIRALALGLAVNASLLQAGPATRTVKSSGAAVDSWPC